MVNKDHSQAVCTLLRLERQIVGVKFFFDKESYDQADAKEFPSPMSYCVSVKHAGNGISLKFTAEKSGCGGSTRALGLKAAAESFYSGEDGCALGLYESTDVSSSVAKQMKILPEGTYGVVVKPLMDFEEDPDVIILVGNSYQMMRIIQGYSFSFGMQPHFNMLGNQAICVECTSTPYMTDTLNISMLCSGTRFLAKWNENEAAAGLPYSKFEGLLHGLLHTANAVEMVEQKKCLQEKLNPLLAGDSPLNTEEPYYLKLERLKMEAKANHA